MFKKKKWTLTRAPGAEVRGSNGTELSLSSTEKANRDGSTLRSADCGAPGQPPEGTQNSSENPDVFLTRNEPPSAATGLEDAQATEVKNKTDRSMGGGNPRLTGATDKETASLP